MMAALSDGRADLPTGTKREYGGYCGDYTFDGTTLTTTVDAAPNQALVGTVQTRGVRFEGERMILRPPPREIDSVIPSSRTDVGTDQSSVEPFPDRRKKGRGRRSAKRTGRRTPISVRWVERSETVIGVYGTFDRVARWLHDLIKRPAIVNLRPERAPCAQLLGPRDRYWRSRHRSEIFSLAVRMRIISIVRRRLRFRNL